MNLAIKFALIVWRPMCRSLAGRRAVVEAAGQILCRSFRGGAKHRTRNPEGGADGEAALDSGFRPVAGPGM